MEEKKEEEQSIFDGAEVTEEAPTKEEVEESQGEEEPEIFKPSISTESEKAKLERKGKKEEADGKVLTIKDWDFTRPKTKNQDGTEIPPKETLKEKKPYYGAKLVIRFEEDNLIEYYPNVKFFVNNGVMSNNLKLPRLGESQVAILARKIIEHIGKPSDEIPDLDLLDWMKGKKVKIKTAKGKFDGKEWFRNDVEEFVLEGD